MTKEKDQNSAFFGISDNQIKYAIKEAKKGLAIAKNHCSWEEKVQLTNAISFQIQSTEYKKYKVSK